jgi:hypothetical protein
LPGQLHRQQELGRTSVARTAQLPTEDNKYTMAAQLLE